MRPVKLTFAGLRSYRAETVIDFTNLDLFAVIGDTGAGKSTILEALSLALYARKSWTGGAGLAEMIADGENTMRIEFTFIVNGHTWTVSRARHRNNSKPVDKLTSPTGGGANVDGAREVNDAVTALLGLNHEQFTRAVVLPQGKFDMLLRAQPADRTKILSSLLGLDDVVRARASVDQLKNHWSPTLARFRERRQHLPTDPAGELDAALADEQRARERLELLQRVSTQVTALTAQSSIRISHLERLGRTQTAVPPSVPGLQDELARLDTLAAALAARRADLDGRVLQLAAAAERIATRMVELLDGFPGRDDLVAARGLLDTIAAALDADTATAAQLAADHATLAGNEPTTADDPTLVAAEAQARTEHQRAQQARAVTDQQLGRARDLWAQARDLDARLAGLAADHARQEGVCVDADRALDDARRAAQESENRVADVRAELRHAELADAAAAIAAACGPGDPCPVCARPLPDGFTPASDAGTDTLRTRLDEADAEAATVAKAVAVARDEATRARSALTHIDETVAEAEAARRQVDATAATEGILLGGTEQDTVAPLLEALGAVTAVEQAASDDAAKASEALSRDRADRRLRFERYTTDLAHAAHAAQQAAATVDAHRARLGRLPVSWQPATFDGAGCQLLVIRAARVLEDLSTAEHDASANASELADLRAELASLEARTAREVTGPLSRIVTSINARTTRVREVAAAVAAVAELPDVAIDDVTEDDVVLCAAEIERGVGTVLDASAAAITALTAEQEAADQELRRLLAEAGGGDATTVAVALGDATGKVRAAAERVANAREAVTTAGEVSAVLDVLEPFLANLTVLSVALRDSQFIGHLVSSREHELLVEATRRLLAISGGRFAFYPGFDVVSVSSGEVRSPDTLSGGERFQAALALALGLVEIASRGGGRLDAVFIDEGFGSLDSHALDVALETLGTVSGAGKMVALISHLQPVADYVDTVLHVTKDDLFGSRIDVLTGDAREQLIADDVRSRLTN